MTIKFSSGTKGSGTLFSCEAKTLDWNANGEIDDEVLYAATLGLISIKSLKKDSDSWSKGINFSESDG